jgi:hypothetical protein
MAARLFSRTVLPAQLINKAGFTQKTAQTGAVTLIQRFGSALNLNVYFHIFFLDGFYIENKHGKIHFQRASGSEQQELALLVHAISHRNARFLECIGLLEREKRTATCN